MSFAEQLAARAAKRTGGGSSSANNSPLSSPSRKAPIINNGSSPSRAATSSLAEQIKSRAEDRSNRGRLNNDNNAGDGGNEKIVISSANTVDHSTTDHEASTQQQQHVQSQVSPVRISSSRSRLPENNNHAATSSSGVSTTTKDQAPRVDNVDNSIKSDIINNNIENTITQSKSTINSSPQTPLNPNPQSTPPTTTDQQLLLKLKTKVDKYKSESKKLRHENLLLKAKSEEMATLVTKLQMNESTYKVEKEGLLKQVEELSERVEVLQEDCLVLQQSSSKNDNPDNDNNGGEGEEEWDGNGVTNKEKDEEISALNERVTQMEEELAEVTELKNAEIEVLRKQLNRVEQQYNHYRNNNRDTTSQDAAAAAANLEDKQQEWNKERTELREEIRRLNLEVSRQMSNRLDQEEEEDNAKYNGSSTSLFITSPKNLDNSDIASLQSIIGMMRQTIDQCNKEKEELEQRLVEEQERSQLELKAFAKTLEGVDDLRKSAETMSREIRRIKVKGYRLTRSDLMGGGNHLEGVRNFGELTAAVEASESMEEAIRMIEGQNDALEERRRMGVVAASVSRESVVGTTTATASAAPHGRKGGVGLLRAISEDDNDGGGFLSFWNGAGRGNDDGEDDDDDDDVIVKREKKKKSKHKKKRRDDEGSVFTSFF